MQFDKDRVSVTRRKFMRNSALIASSAIVVNHSYAEAPPSILQEDEPIALALGYKADATSVDTAKYPKRQGEKGEVQFCSTCSLYAEHGSSGYGTCTAIPSKLVAGSGWCNAWIPKL